MALKRDRVHRRGALETPSRRTSSTRFPGRLVSFVDTVIWSTSGGGSQATSSTWLRFDGGQCSWRETNRTRCCWHWSLASPTGDTRSRPTPTLNNAMERAPQNCRWCSDTCQTIARYRLRRSVLQLCQKTEKPDRTWTAACLPHRIVSTEGQSMHVAVPDVSSPAGKTTNLAHERTLPAHIGVIMDGNGRWGMRARGSRSAGHEQGLQALQALIEDCLQWRIPFLTVFAFSTENWRRPSSEVTYLFSLFDRVVQVELEKWHARGVRLIFIGERSALPEPLRRRMNEAEERTATNQTLCLQIALNYSGRQDIVRAARSLALDVKAGILDPRRIDEKVFATYLAECWGIDVPDPDLIIRTGGEQRLSNFMLWQAAYTEIYVTDTLWPEFTSTDFLYALDAFHERRRRFGGVSGHGSSASPTVSDCSSR
ncbi:hypothetical protein F1559_000430 [Cyanidiococcus yangmingshanensis]|uniref:Isoprenyl transferase n=1 Tax=Cyanidiococcus yangmingshanensis TaxID=2690220 RepID=A0A7J7IK20_9RHOD|nr:hypothetical protein F1559_000430 [Cyanidiococcus yangmingshanensis]